MLSPVSSFYGAVFNWLWRFLQTLPSVTELKLWVHQLGMPLLQQSNRSACLHQCLSQEEPGGRSWSKGIIHIACSQGGLDGVLKKVQRVLGKTAVRIQSTLVCFSHCRRGWRTLQGWVFVWANFLFITTFLNSNVLAMCVNYLHERSINNQGGTLLLYRFYKLSSAVIYWFIAALKIR